MKIILDTHTFLWWITDDQRLSPHAHEIMEDGKNELLFSAVSAWEMAIKIQLGRLSLPGEPEVYIPDQLRQNAMHVLPIQVAHALQVANLPRHHRDPFDRLLVAQAQVEAVPILSADPNIGKYEVEVIW